MPRIKKPGKNHVRVGRSGTVPTFEEAKALVGHVLDDELIRRLIADRTLLWMRPTEPEPEKPKHEPRKREKCGAHARSTGKPCQAPALPNGRCKLHGGLSTGPRTPEGLKRLEAAVRERWRQWRIERGLPADRDVT